MSKKETTLIKVTYIVELSNNEATSSDDMLDYITSKLCNDKKVKINDKEIKLKWNSTTSLILDPKYNNCGKCVNCGAWTTDCEKIDPISVLKNGAVVDEKLLCNECLPENHPWAF
ncbi:MAG: hypothetical protein GYA50_02870 [Eubacteriaceae bacterium]|nr:hypothetical protein [Eubacteriaceae bacterium]